jgi:hypothetical protein
MVTDIRVRIETTHRDLYDDMKEQWEWESHELFFVCACLGYSLGIRKELARPYDRFWSSTITPHEWSCLYAMAVELADFDYGVLGDPKRVIFLAEAFANGGMQHLLDDFLGDYVTKGPDGGPRLMPGSCQNLPRAFLLHLKNGSQ